MKCTIFSPVAGFSLYSKAYGNRVASEMLLKGEIKPNVEPSEFVKTAEKTIDNIVSTFMINDAGFSNARFETGTEYVKKAKLNAENYGLKFHTSVKQNKNTAFFSLKNNNKPLTKAEVYQHILKQSVKDNLINPETPNKDFSVEDTVKEGVEELFGSNPELSSIGTPEQYSQYLDTIFPDSKVKDIVYHGAMEQLLPKDGKFKGYVTYFSTSKKYSETFGFPVNRKIVSAITNIINPYNAPSELADVPEEIHNTDRFTNPRLIKSNTKGYDSVIGIDAGQKEGKTLAVFEPEQIHILGNEQDVKGFKNFVNQKISYSIEDSLFEGPINYALKTVNVITNNINKIKQWESNKSIDNNTFWNKVQQLGISKEQLELLKQSEGNNIEEKLTSFIANYSYTIEINTAKGLGDYYSLNNKYYLESFEDEISYYVDIEGNEIVTKNVTKYRILNPNGAEAFEFENKIEAEKKLEELNSNLPNSNVYSNLTVAGGTNYTENEIATPAITPSIKGHAQFATPNGIGWFRSDDKSKSDKALVDGYFYYTENDGETAKFVKHSFNSYLNKNKEGKQYISAVEYGKAESKYNFSTKTRRILEVQSDLFQKGRDKEDLTTIKYNFQPTAKYLFDEAKERGIIDEDGYSYNGYVYRSVKNGFVESYERRERKDNISKYKNEVNQNKFLQLLNKDNNWVTFFIKSIIQDSAKKGYEKVLFPSGNTASKIEGHTTLEEFKKQKEDRIKELENELKDTFIKDGKITDGLNRNKGLDSNYDNFKKNINNEINRLKQELERVEREGFGTLKPIYKFYEVNVKNTLDNILGGNKNNRKKGIYKFNQITDEFGNTWNEVILDEKRDLDTIYFSIAEEPLNEDTGLNEELANEFENIPDFVFDFEDSEGQTVDVDYVNYGKYIEYLNKKKRNSSNDVERDYYDSEIKNAREILKALMNTDNLTNDYVLQIVDSMIGDLNVTLNKDINISQVSDLSFLLGSINSILESVEDDVKNEDIYKLLKGKVARASEEINRKSIIVLKQNLANDTSPASKEAAINELDDILNKRELEDDSFVSAMFHSAFNSISALVQSIVYTINQRKLTIDARKARFMEEMELMNKKLGRRKKEAFDLMIQKDFDGNPTGFMLQQISGDYFKLFSKGLRTLNNLGKEPLTVKDVQESINELNEAGTFTFDEAKFDSEIAPVLSRKMRNYLSLPVSLVRIDFEKKYMQEHPTATKVEVDTAFEAELDVIVPKAIENKKSKLKSLARIVNNKLNVNNESNVKKIKQAVYVMNEVKMINKDVFKHNPKESFYDERYAELMSRPDSDSVKEYYLWYMDKLETFRKELGIVNDYYQPLSYIPEVMKEVELFENGLTGVKSSFMQGISSLKTKESSFLLTADNTPVYDIPFNVLSGNLTASEKSYELDKVMEVFVGQVLHKVEMSKVQDVANIALTIIKEAKFAKKHQNETVISAFNGKSKVQTESGNMSMTFSVLNNFIRTQIYKDAQDDEVTGKEFQLPLQKKRIKELKQKVETGEITSAEKAELRKLESRTYVKSQAKAGNKLIKLTALKALGLSLFGGVFETVNGVMSNLVWASSEGDFTLEALNSTFKHVLAMAKPNSNTKYEQILKAFNIKSTTDYTLSDTNVTKFENIAFKPYSLGDKFNKCWTTLALLETQGILENLEVVDGVLYKNGVQMSQEEINHVTITVNEIHKNINSRSNELDPILANRKIIGRLILQFRGSWLFEGFRKRFGATRKNTVLNRVTKGYYNSLFDVIVNNSRVDGADGEPVISNSLIFKNVLKFILKREIGTNVTSIDKQNLQRAHKEIMVIATLTLLYVALNALEGDDDDDENNPWIAVLNPLQNSLYRLSRDSTFFINPMSTSSILSNIAPSITTLTDFYKVLRDIWQLPYDPYYYEGTKREVLKLQRDVPKAFPIINQPKKLIDMFETDLDEKKSR